jgi:hypothetical protein
MRHGGVPRKVVLIGLAGSVLALLTACSGGVSQSEYDSAKQQLAAQDQKVSALQQQLSAKDKQVADLQQKPAAPAGAAAGIQPILAAQKAAPRLTPTPLPAGATPAPKPAAPVPPKTKTVPLYAHIDTITSAPGESLFNVDATSACVKTSQFSRGMHLVWRMELVDTSTGKILQDADVKSASVKLPTGEEAKFRYGRHGATEDSPWFWTAAWDVPLEFPLGVLEYGVTVVTQDGKSITVADPLAVSMPERQIESRVVIVPAPGS